MVTRGLAAAIATTTAGGQQNGLAGSEPAVFTSCRARPRTALATSAELIENTRNELMWRAGEGPLPACRSQAV